MPLTIAKLDDHAVEKSTFIVVVTLTNEEGNAAIPVSLTWTLTDVNGTVINEKENVSVETPASVNNIVLTGDDLAVTESESKVKRLFTVQGTYNSDLGAGLDFKDSIAFDVKNLKVVT